MVDFLRRHIRRTSGSSLRSMTMTDGLRILDEPPVAWCTDPDKFNMVVAGVGPKTEVRLLIGGMQVYDPDAPVYGTGPSLETDDAEG